MVCGKLKDAVSPAISAVPAYPNPGSQEAPISAGFTAVEGTRSRSLLFRPPRRFINTAQTAESGSRHVPPNWPMAKAVRDRSLPAAT